MFGLNESAVLRACVGRRGGRSVYAEPGAAFRCRSEVAARHSARGDSVERGADVRIFAQGIDPRPGDRVDLGGAHYRIAEVRRMRGLAGVHHLEILARPEGRGEER